MAGRLSKKEFEELPLGLRQPVKNLLEHENASEKLKAIEELGECYEEYEKPEVKKLILKHLITAFEDENLNVRAKAKTIIQAKIGLRALQQLIETLKTTENNDVKKLIAETLSKIRSYALTTNQLQEIQPFQQPLHFALKKIDPNENLQAFLKLIEETQNPKHANKTTTWWEYYAQQIENKYAKKTRK